MLRGERARFGCGGERCFSARGSGLRTTPHSVKWRGWFAEARGRGWRWGEREAAPSEVPVCGPRPNSVSHLSGERVSHPSRDVRVSHYSPTPTESVATRTSAHRQLFRLTYMSVNTTQALFWYQASLDYVSLWYDTCAVAVYKP